MATKRKFAAVEVPKALPGTNREIALRTGFYQNTVWLALKKLRAAGLCHVGGWQRVHEGEFGVHWVRVYVAGPGKDAPCRFTKRTAEENTRRCTERAKESGYHETICARKRARYWEQKAAKRGDPLVNAFFGKKQPTEKQCSKP